VSEAMVFADAAKTAVAENAANGAALNAGWSAPSGTENVKSVAINDTTGVITIEMTSKSGGDGKTVTFTPKSGGSAIAAGTVPTDAITWDCTGGDLEKKYRPSQCRAT